MFDSRANIDFLHGAFSDAVQHQINQTITASTSASVTAVHYDRFRLSVMMRFDHLAACNYTAKQLSFIYQNNYRFYTKLLYRIFIKQSSFIYQYNYHHRTSNLLTGIYLLVRLEI